MNHSKIYFLFIISLLLSYATQLNGQASEEEGFQRRVMLNKAIVTPSTPEASSLGKFGEFNIDPYVGSINIQIPILTMAGKTTAIPINLLYNGTSVKVNEREGWTGLNWNLTANFAITRSVVGLPDLNRNYFDKKDSIQAITYTDQIKENQFLYKIARGYIETQPDHFYLAYPGGSLKFYITPDKKIIRKSHQNVAITPSFDVDGDIIKFTVHDDKGVKYEFSDAENTKLTLDDWTEGEIGPSEFQYFYNSAWHLTKITGTNGIETFLFDYHSAALAYDLDINDEAYKSITYPPPNIQNPNYCGGPQGAITRYGQTSTTSVTERRHLHKIKYLLGADTIEQVEFVSVPVSQGAACQYAGHTDRQLNQIKCYKGKNGQVNILNFDFTYNCSTNRLMLQSVQEKSATNVDSKPAYTFTYNEQLLPSYISNSVDHFGYFNNAGNGDNLIPKITPQGGTVLNSLGANRNPSETYAKAGILESIKYPTQGYTEYNWEKHEIAGIGAGSYYDYAPTQSGANDRAAGGVRIASIENFDCDGTSLLKKSYRYVKSGNPLSNQSSSGIMLNEPNYSQIAINTTYPANNTCNRIVISATSRSALGTIKGSHVGYSRVEEITEANDGSNATSGKVVHHFKNQKLTVFGTKDNVENGLVTLKEVYNATDDILEKTIYTYSTEEGENRKSPFFAGFRVVPEEEQDNKSRLCKNTFGSYEWYVENEQVNCVEEDIFKTKFKRQYTTHEQRWVYQSEMEHIRYFYDDNNNSLGSVSTITDYIYNDTTTNQPTETLVYNSDGKVYKTTTHFVNSFDDTEYPVSDDSGLFVRAMQLNYMTSFPLVQAQYIDDELVYKTKLNYSTRTGLILPYKLYETFPSKSDVLAEVFDNYDDAGNLTQGHRHFENANGETNPIALIYNNEESRLIAQAKNAEAGEIAYTSFETEDAIQGRWSVPSPERNAQFSHARTGNYAYQTLSGSPITASVRAGKYLISYYINNSSDLSISGSGVTELNKKTSPVDDEQGWYYVTHAINVSNLTTINLSSSSDFYFIDELRLCPYDALMTTYVYDNDTRLPVSIMDENSIPTRFEYDGLLRLKGTKNFNDYYLSLHEYAYKIIGCTIGHNVIKNWTVLASGQLSATNAKSLGTSGALKDFAYFDGIGRPIQSVSIEQSPSGNDIVQFMNYDKFGREAEKYLPYTISGSTEVFRSSPETEQAAFFGSQFSGQGENNYGKMVYNIESSPLNRIFTETPEGNAFQSNPKQIKYQVNGTDEVRDFHVAGTGSWYMPNTLYKTIQLDENGNSIITYTDKINRRIMQDQEGSKTYFLYDSKGLLTQIIQPEAAEKGHNNLALINTSTEIAEGSFLYTFDAEYRLETKIVPGCQAYTYYYDDLDQAVLTIDGNGFKTFTKYDRLGRPIMTGKYIGSDTPIANGLVYEERNTDGNNHYYTTNQSFPTDGQIDIYNITYYDNYDFNNDYADDISYQNTTIGNYDADDYPFVRGKEIANKVAILKNNGATPDSYLNGYSFFDKFCRVIQTKSDNHLGGTDIVWNEYNFSGWLMNTRREHTTIINGQANAIITNEEFTYDDIGRQIDHYHQLGDNAVDKKLVCYKSYNERDELAQKKIGETTSNTFLQTIDYNYNIRKWLTGINDANSLGNDLFAMDIDYVGSGATANYNGNISKIEWKTTGYANKKIYNYTYDKLDRITTSIYSETNNSNQNDHYNTNYNYDKNGNFGTINRNGMRLDGSFGQIDGLDYNYDNEGRLTSLEETSFKDAGFRSAAIDGNGAYAYDDNGNRITDAHKGITIAYNFLNLPELVTKDDGSTIEWLYDAFGNKLEKSVSIIELVVDDNPILSKEYKATQKITSKGTVVTGSNVIFTAGQKIELIDGFNSDNYFVAQIQANTTANEVRDYIAGIEYFEGITDAVYFDGGRVKYEINNADYQYLIEDYLKNARVLFSDSDNNNNISQDEILDISSYYPFGFQHQGANAKSSGSHQYLYNGKELDSELGLDWYHYGARMYDPCEGRFTGVDPIADKFAWVSTYNYAENEPIANIDLWGLQQHRMADGSTMTGPISPEVLNKVNESIVENQIKATTVTETISENYSPQTTEALLATGDLIGFTLNVMLTAEAGGQLMNGLAKTGMVVSATSLADDVVSKIQTLNPHSIRFSQSSVNGAKDLIKSMKQNGWKGDPIDVVKMKDGGLTTIDNTRVLAASEAGVKVKAVVRNFDEALPAEMIERFTTKKGTPSTWGEAVKLRIGKQKAAFRNNNPNGSYNIQGKIKKP